VTERSLIITPADLAAERARLHEGTNVDDLARGATSGAATLAAAAAASAAHPEPPRSWSAVPWRTIVATVAVVLATILLVALVLATLRIIAWLVVSGFFALVLAPLVRRLEARLGGRRNVATLIVVLGAVITLLGSIALFVLPIRDQLVSIITDLPGTIEDAADGRGPVGDVVEELGLVGYVQDHEAELERAAERLTGFEMVQTVAAWLFAFVTITLVTILMLTQSSTLGKVLLGLVPARRRESVRRTSVEAAGAVSGYMIGNLLVSLVAGVTALLFLVVLGVPNALVLALLVAFTDLLPLVGATLGAVVVSIAAFLHEPSAGIACVVFFVVYQQIENYVIYPAVMARTVKVNPLVVLLSVLVGVELFGIIGAVLAVPVSGAVQVAIKAVRRERDRDRLVLPASLDEPERAGAG